jgi:hypothetical protein
MRDPHIHAEKTLLPGFGNAQMRDFIARATGMACDLPKTAGTGCRVRRPIVMTSTVPERVTCLPCREWAAAQLRGEIASAEALLGLPDSSDWSVPAGDRAAIAGQLTADRAMLARYETQEARS